LFQYYGWCSIYLPETGLSGVGLDTGVGLGERRMDSVDDNEIREILLNLLTGGYLGENGRVIIPAASSAMHLNTRSVRGMKRTKELLISETVYT